MASIKLSNVCKSYGGLEVMRDVSFDIEDGEFVVLVGPSGCGKSTLIRMIAGLEEISSGEVMIDDKQVNNVSAKDRDIAMVFQSYALYPHMNVEQNMGFSLRIDGRPKDEIRKKVAEAAEALELTPLLRRKPGQLSGGQRQRVAMGRAIVRDPRAFLFDEPLSNLDAQLRVQMRAEITLMQKKYKTTTVYVTHDQVEAMTMADRIVVLRAGRVEQVGTPLDLFDQPQNIFVARFLGSPQMNFIPGVIEARGGQCFFKAEGVDVEIAAAYANHDGLAVQLGIRPSHVYRTRLGGEGALQAKIAFLENTGSETMLKLDLQGHAIQCVINERLSEQQGDAMIVSFDPDCLHLFDARTEQRLDAGVKNSY